MSLYTGPQLIFGKKLFKNQVVFKDAVAFEKGWTGHRGETSAIRDRGMGELHLLTEANRPTDWILNAGSATTYTDVDFSSYCPSGTRALLLKVRVILEGDGALDGGAIHVRKHGSAISDGRQVARLTIYREDQDNGVYIGIESSLIVECDITGVVEYAVSDAAVDGYLNIMGYWI